MQKRKERIDRGIKARSEDIFVLCSYQEMFYLLAPRVVPILCILLLSFFIPAYWQKVLVNTAVFTLLALSWDLLASTGMVSLGQAFFFGVGAYVAGYLNHRFGWSPLLTIPIGSILGGIICTIILLPALRLREVYFAMLTLVLPIAVVRIIEATRIFGGTEGMSALTPFPNRWAELCIIIIALFICLFGFRRLINTDYGLVLKGINDNDRSVMNVGINIYWYKAQALFIASAVAAFAGAFSVHLYMFVGMPMFYLDYSIMPIAAAVVGGVGGFAGAVLGAFILVPLSELLRGLGGLRIVIYGLLLTVFIVALPEGIFHFVARKYHQFDRWVKVEK